MEIFVIYLHSHDSILYPPKGHLNMSKVKSSPKLIKEGKLSYEWARSHMQILDNTINRLKKSKPLKGITLVFCLHVTKETSVFLMGAK